MGVILLVIVWIVMGIIIYKLHIKHKAKRLKQTLVKQKANLEFIALNTYDDTERADALMNIEKCDKAIKNLEKQWY